MSHPRESVPSCPTQLMPQSICKVPQVLCRAQSIATQNFSRRNPKVINRLCCPPPPKKKHVRRRTLWMHPTWWADSRSASQELPHLLWQPVFRNRPPVYSAFSRLIQFWTACHIQLKFICKWPSHLLLGQTSGSFCHMVFRIKFRINFLSFQYLLCTPYNKIWWRFRPKQPQ